MDVDDEWELLSDDGFLDDAGNQIYSRNSSVIHTNYFICPPQFVETTANRILPDRDQINISTGGVPAADQDPISQVFFKKAEFVDMKVDSPKGDPCKFDSEMAIENDKDDANVWKRSLSGIGAICSFGVAAATFCIIIFTNKHNHKLQFRIYTDEERMKVKGAMTRARITVGGYYDAAL